MFASAFSYLKNHKLTVLLLLVIFYLLLNTTGRVIPLPAPRSGVSYDMAEGIGGVAMAPALEKFIAPAPDDGIAPSTSPDRLVVKNSNLSLQVKDVRNTLDAIQAKTEELGGFMVNTHLSTPDSASTGSITVRVPSDQLEQALEAFRTLAVKVVSESISGTDVTDQYEDLNARLQVLLKTQTKFQAIQDQATEISDLLEVQRELVSLQSQIDNLKGRQDYLEKTARLAAVTIYLSTDELALPYSPDGAWRPEVVFKTAVRSLVGNFRSLGNALIWLAVYSPIIILIVIAWILIKRRRQQK